MTRRFLISVLPATLTVPLLRAQADPRIQETIDRLELTPEQVEQVRPILQREMEKARAVLQNLDRTSSSRREKRKMARELKAIRNDVDDQLKGILTPGQMAELQRIREDRRQKLKAARKTV